MPFRGFVTRHGWLIAIAVTYLYIFPYFPRIQSANELPRVYLIKAIADDHTFQIDRGVARWGSTADVSPSRGHLYSNKAPGSSMLAAPPYLAVAAVAGEPGLATSMWIARVFAGIVPALLFLALLYRFLERFTPDPVIRQLVCLAYGLGSMAMTYSILFYSHQLAAACIGSAWILGLDAAERRRGLGAVAAAGALAGCAPLVDYQAAFAGVPLAVHLVAKLWAWPRRELVRALAIAAAAAAVPIAILLAYHAACFGSPLRTGYDASTTFAHHHQAGFLGITELRWEAFVGSFVKIDNGLVALAPWLALAIPGVFVLARGLHLPRGESRPRARADRFRANVELGAGVVLVAAAIALGVATRHGGVRTTALVALLGLGTAALWAGAARLVPARGGDRGTAAVIVAIAVLYTLFISSINFWRGGWGVGPRYITVMLPFLLPAIAVLLAAVQRRSRFALGAVAGLMLVGIAIYTLSSVTFPYWPDSLKHPLYDVTFRMLREDLVAANLGRALGVDGVLGLAPVLALVAAAFGIALRRAAGWGGVAIAAAVAALVLAGYGLLPRGGAQANRAFTTVKAAVQHL